MAQYTFSGVIKYIKWRDIAAIFKCIFIAPFALLAKIFIRNFWLVCEDENEARDNGYWFFKWVRENRPKQKIAYAINKKAKDYDRVKRLGKTIGYGSFAHWFWYIVADKNISSQKGGKPNAAVCYAFEVVLGLRKNNRIFLQHGVTINKGEWLYFKNTKFKVFITASKQEDEFVRQYFGYPNDRVKLLGFCRFDNLHDAEIDKDLILAMPTWRNWLGRESSDNAHVDFGETEYCKKWNEFLQSKELATVLEKHGKKLIFFPHRNMQKFIDYFKTESRNIEIADGKKYEIQELLKRASVMITDYSSVFFDFAYMRKPVLFYQFDEAEFRARQYAQGYLDYHNTSLGKWTDNMEELVSMLDVQLSEEYRLMPEDKIKEIFPFYDKGNCERTYEMIEELQ